MAYVYGRRVCVGKYVTNNSLFIGTATLLWAVRFERKKDVEGNEEPVNVDDFVDDSLVKQAEAVLAEARELQR
ncbi:hypothetical protein BC834DRAFT_972409 [Gloeopeniophorella convolvens]|nr:hypothetical protein BC834DRAFT_972409 [Gloeopeniophorella convolvens]